MTVLAILVVVRIVRCRYGPQQGGFAPAFDPLDEFPLKMIHTFQPSRIAGATLLALSLFVALPAMAGDYGCEIPCDTCPCEIGACDGCDSCGSSKGNCFTDGFKKLSSKSNAGFCKMRDQFKKMCSIDFSCFKLCGGKSSMCDDACDAAMMGDLMQGAQPVIEYRSNPMPGHIETLPQATPMPVPSNHVPQPIRMDRQETDEELFEKLPDPFQDDEVQASVPRVVQPSSYNEVILRPVPRRPLPRRQ